LGRATSWGPWSSFAACAWESSCELSKRSAAFLPASLRVGRLARRVTAVATTSSSRSPRACCARSRVAGAT
jgi:hypothetical protein